MNFVKRMEGNEPLTEWTKARKKLKLTAVRPDDFQINTE